LFVPCRYFSTNSPRPHVFIYFRQHWILAYQNVLKQNVYLTAISSTKGKKSFHIRIPTDKIITVFFIDNAHPKLFRHFFMYR
jgi:hypothetical protein